METRGVQIVESDWEPLVRQMRNCNNRATHEFLGGRTRPFKRHRARKHACGEVVLGRRLLCDACSKSSLVWLGVLDPL